mmetsp:Transcript_14085/g.30534  ORF Transcript_14085/g.30534 Transcript_14085/m.30534 type:complete len:360 (-) Transcript_14085:671-1750(-)|eukprot:CAMPEP_0202891460 /NCGR_PEP_ID=MMETSP1392-20130828/1508_1 /ASSEMBLY_ACC=CAM_ASM_000868 /TAXON_ID=225041 /ORGANISM="Chlamydomonas chlamydogama, Strain SAG 11-48b" /LENGTH=359 /DNA_ID=CAMNT_0049575209 /DNA_START=66 /DNA_END=1145 /DNA_ORIENTATION=+
MHLHSREVWLDIPPETEMLFSGEGDFVVCPRWHDGTPSTIRHWQLRNLVSFGCSEEDVYTVHGTSIMLYRLNSMDYPPRRTVVADLAFHASSMTYGQGYLAAGGQSAELEVYMLHGTSTAESLLRGATEGSVNNALHVAPSTSGQTHLYVCNNDSTVKVYSLPSMSRVTNVRCHVPVNYTSASPDRSMLCMVGDCHATMLYRATPSGYQLLATFPDASDSGMSCAWAPGGTCLAAAFQDGTIAVRDHRSSSLVHKYKLQSAGRCVKFSPGPLDLLAFTEHEECAHVVDVRRLDVMQHLCVAKGGVPGSGGLVPGACPPDISGLDFSPSGRRLVVGSEEGMVSWEVDTFKRRAFPSGQLV